MLTQMCLEICNERRDTDLAEGAAFIGALTPYFALGREDRIHTRHDLEGQGRALETGGLVKGPPGMRPAGGLDGDTGTDPGRCDSRRRD